MVIEMPNVENRRSTQLAAVIGVAVAFMTTGCSTIGGHDTLPRGDIEFSDADEIDYRGSAPSGMRVYGTLGAGVSRLEPNTDDADSIEVDENSDAAVHLAAGVDLSKTFSVELHATDLGSASLSPAGSIGYDSVGGSVLAYAGRERARRQGLLGFARAGVTKTSHDGAGDIDFVSDDRAKGILGAGVEYMARNLGVRGEIIYFDEDAQSAQLGLIYRLGGSVDELDEIPMRVPPEPQIPQPPVSEVPELPKMPTPQASPIPNQQPNLSSQQAAPNPTPAPQTTVIPAQPKQPEAPLQDNDADGIPNGLDNCPATDFGREVDDSGCAIFNGVIEGVNFQRGSAALTADARTALNQVILTLRSHPDALIAIAAHTDGLGGEDANMALSQDRAISVARYLIARGVPRANMTARAFGEYQPIASNDTPEGRAQNRRVEIVASKNQAGQ